MDGRFGVEPRASKTSTILDVWGIWGPNTPQGITKSSKYRALKIALPHIVGGLLGVVGPSLVVADIRRNN